MRRVLVTGAAGFIGGHVAAAFARRGWYVDALVHRSPLPQSLDGGNPPRVVCRYGDVTDAASLSGVLRDCGGHLDAIVHCAGRASDVGWRGEFRRANHESVRHLVRLVREQDVGRLVFVSTTDVYGLRDFAGEQEDELALARRPANPYPRFKILAENHIRASLPPDRFTLLRPAQVWGPGDRTVTPRIVKFLRTSPAIVHFGPWRGRNRCPLAHVRNVAIAAVLAAERPEAAGLAIHVIDSEHTTVDAFYRLLAAAYLPGKSFRTVTLPRWAGWLFAGPVTALSNALNLPRPLADPSLYALQTVSHNLDFGNARLRGLFAAAGESLVTLEEGFAELLPPEPGGIPAGRSGV